MNIMLSVHKKTREITKFDNLDETRVSPNYVLVRDMKGGLNRFIIDNSKLSLLFQNNFKMK